jgi:hypothetical protein
MRRKEALISHNTIWRPSINPVACVPSHDIVANDQTRAGVLKRTTNEQRLVGPRPSNGWIKLWNSSNMKHFNRQLIFFPKICWRARGGVKNFSGHTIFRINVPEFWFAVLVLCTQVNMMFVMLLWMCIHTGQAWKIWSGIFFIPWTGTFFKLARCGYTLRVVP